MEQEITILLKELAVQLGTTVEYLWMVTIKQANIQAIISLFFCVLPVLIMGAILGVGVYIHKKVDGGSDKEGVIIFCGVAIVVLLIASCVVWAENIPTIVTCLTNPEYWALDKMLSTLK